MSSPFEDFFREYAGAFDDFDAERIASAYHCPCVLVTEEFVASLTTEDAILSNMRGLLEHQRAQGVGRAVVSDIVVEHQAENLVIVRVRWTLHDREDAPLWNWLNSYNLVDHGSGWKILVSTTHGADAADGSLVP